jgi:hypothetical protein
MKVQCPACGLSGEMAADRIPPTGGHLTCPACRERFFVTNGAAAKDPPQPPTAPSPEEPLPSAAPPAAGESAPHDDDLSFVRRLTHEAEAWEREGLIAAEQRERIVARYRRLREADEKAGPGRLATTITVLGSILVGVGVLLFIASNWSEIPRWGKLALIFTGMLSSYGAGYYLRYEAESYPKAGAALIFVGSMVFGAGIFLIAQIYHITVHYPNGPLMWGLAVLPLAYLLRLRSILSLSLLVLLVWLGMELRFWTVAIS